MIINVTHDDGTIDQHRRNLLADANRTAQITGRKFEDLDGDTVYDAGEIGLNGWTVELVDLVNGDVLQTQVTADIDLDNSGTIELATERGVYRFVDLTAGIYLVREVLQSGWEAVDTAEMNVLIAGGDEAVVDFANRLQDGAITGTAFDDINGDGAHDSSEPGLPGVTIYVDLNHNEVLDEAIFNFDSGDVSAAINDLARTDVPLRVTGLAGVIIDVQLGFDMAHGYIGDLNISLVSPSGNSVLMLSNVGGNNTAFVDTTLDDAAATSIGDAVAPFTGTFRPRFPLSFFDGEDPNGIWTLQIVDAASGDVGELRAWSLAFDLAEPLAVTTEDDPNTTEINESGRYTIHGLPGGDYAVRQVVEPGLRITEPASGVHQVKLAGAQVIDGIDFAITRSGDVNGDGSVDNTDITPFIRALSIGGEVTDHTKIDAFQARVPGGAFAAADVNADGFVNNTDITPFIAVLAQAGAAGSTTTTGGEHVDILAAIASMSARSPGLRVTNSHRRGQDAVNLTAGESRLIGWLNARQAGSSVYMFSASSYVRLSSLTSGPAWVGVRLESLTYEGGPPSGKRGPASGVSGKRGQLLTIDDLSNVKS